MNGIILLVQYSQAWHFLLKMQPTNQLSQNFASACTVRTVCTLLPSVDRNADTPNKPRGRFATSKKPHGSDAGFCEPLAMEQFVRVDGRCGMLFQRGWLAVKPACPWAELSKAMETRADCICRGGRSNLSSAGCIRMTAQGGRRHSRHNTKCAPSSPFQSKRGVCHSRAFNLRGSALQVLHVSETARIHLLLTFSSPRAAKKCAAVMPEPAEQTF
jgi:hypothetical protein